MDGFDFITSEDKSRIINSVETGNVTRKLPIPKAIHSKTKVPIHVPSKFRKFQLKSTNLPSFNVMFTNADLPSAVKMSELIEHIQKEKPLVITICEVKSKHNERTEKDFSIPGYSIHPVNY